jgi:RES domain-containing protein
MIYASEHYSTAVLEKLVHGSGHMPPNQHFVEITVPNGVTYALLDPAHLPGRADVLATDAKAYGAVWQTARRSLLLIVPSVVARMEHNILVNPEHTEFHRLRYGLHRPVWWDRRLFGRSG